jgi:hypothetical protein
MTSNDFLKIINDAFKTFLTDLGFVLGPASVSGRLYDVSFSRQDYVVSISYEPGDEYFLIIVFSKNAEDQLSNIDDRKQSPRLEDLNKIYMPLITADQRAQNELFFRLVVPENKSQKMLLKAAKELRLVLPLYLVG